MMPAPRAYGETGVATPAYVYAIGRIEPRFPTLSAEKEFAQATGRAETAGLSDRRALHAVLSQRENRYLARQFCWVLTIESLDTYILQPRDPADLDLLVPSRPFSFVRDYLKPRHARGFLLVPPPTLGECQSRASRRSRASVQHTPADMSAQTSSTLQRYPPTRGGGQGSG